MQERHAEVSTHLYGATRMITARTNSNCTAAALWLRRRSGAALPSRQLEVVAASQRYVWSRNAVTLWRGVWVAAVFGEESQGRGGGDGGAGVLWGWRRE